MHYSIFRVLILLFIRTFEKGNHFISNQYKDPSLDQKKKIQKSIQHSL